MSDDILEKEKEEKKDITQPEDIVIYDKNKPLYSRQHLCIYLRELYDLAEKEQQESKEKGDKEEDKP
ncbi:MAG TPA: hypothetical protein PLW88_04690 [Syntrophorhabdaceae bacterium]|nr:hypothetical protein [Syntrophorhabdaceae bacterium]